MNSSSTEYRERLGGVFTLKKRHPAFAGRRAGDAITGGVLANFCRIDPQQSSDYLPFHVGNLAAPAAQEVI